MGTNLKELLSKLENVAEIKGKVNDKLAKMSIEGDAGGGLVRVIVNGLKDIDSITIDDSLMNIESKDMLCDLIITAHHVANGKVEEKVENITMESSMDFLPDLFK
ncbi:MAG: YbaB/EbfC family nucleoid-associated protein [Bacteroidota bacterium]